MQHMSASFTHVACLLSPRLYSRTQHDQERHTCKITACPSRKCLKSLKEWTWGHEGRRDGSAAVKIEDLSIQILNFSEFREWSVEVDLSHLLSK
jgi:hypothetical protein